MWQTVSVQKTIKILSLLKCNYLLQLHVSNACRVNDPLPRYELRYWGVTNHCYVYDILAIEQSLSILVIGSTFHWLAELVSSSSTICFTGGTRLSQTEDQLYNDLSSSFCPKGF